MPVAVHFQEGFQDDHVDVVADGQVVHTEDHLTTNLSSSVAGIARLEGVSAASLDIEVPSRGLTATVDLPPDDASSIVSVNVAPDGSRLDVRLEGEEPLYL